MSDTKQVTKTSETKGPKQGSPRNQSLLFSYKGNGQGEKERKEGTQKRQYNKDNNHEENKEAKQPYVHKPRKPHYKEKIVVTLDTEVPELPKKNEIHPKPDDDAFQNELDKIQKSIDDLYKQMVC